MKGEKDEESKRSGKSFSTSNLRAKYACQSQAKNWESKGGKALEGENEGADKASTSLEKEGSTFVNFVREGV